MRDLGLAEPLPSQSSEVEYPLMLNIYTPLVFNQAIDSNVPWLQDISGSYINSGWNTWVEVNPETAERLKIHNGDRVVVESPKGKISATAKVFNGVMPNVVSLPFGMGRRANGRWQRGIGDNPLEILDKAIDQLTGETIWNSTRVKIYKI